MTHDERIRERMQDLYDGLRPAKSTVSTIVIEKEQSVKKQKIHLRGPKLAFTVVCVVLILAVGAIAVSEGLQFLKYGGMYEGVPLYGTEVPAAERELPAKLREELARRVAVNRDRNYVSGVIEYASKEELEAAIGFEFLSPEAPWLETVYVRISGGVENFSDEVEQHYDLLDEEGIRIGDCHQSMVLNQVYTRMSWGLGNSELLKDEDDWLETSYLTDEGIEADILYNPVTGEAHAMFWHDNSICTTILYLFTEERMEVKVSAANTRAVEPGAVLSYMQDILDSLE